MIAHLVVVPNNNEEEQHNNELMIHNEPIMEEPQVALKRSQRERRPAISNDYMVYLHEIGTDLSINVNDPVSFSRAVSCDNSEKWLNAIWYTFLLFSICYKIYKTYK